MIFMPEAVGLASASEAKTAAVVMIFGLSTNDFVAPLPVFEKAGLSGSARAELRRWSRPPSGVVRVSAHDRD